MSKRFETSEGLPQYFKDLEATAQLLTKEQDATLATRIQSGDEAAYDTLVQANLKFVVTLANKFIGMGLSIDDLIQEGNLGLMEAARKFTPDKGVKFITYAQFWIRKRLNLALCEHGRTVRIPVNQEYDLYKKKMRGEEVNLHNVEIDKPLSNEEGSNTVGDIILKVDAFDPFEQIERDALIRGLLSVLKESEKEIVMLFYGLTGDGLSTKEIADTVSKTPVEVNRALKVARAKMRNLVNA